MPAWWLATVLVSVQSSPRSRSTVRLRTLREAGGFATSVLHWNEIEFDFNHLRGHATEPIAKRGSHTAIVFANRVASAGRLGAIWAAFWATFWAAGRGTRRCGLARFSVAKVPRGVFFGTSKKRRSDVALRNMSHPRMGSKTRAPVVLVDQRKITKNGGYD